MGRPFGSPIKRLHPPVFHWEPFGLGLIPNADFRRHKAFGGGYTVFGLKLAGGVFAMAVDRAGLDTQLAGDLLGIEMRMYQAQALTLALCQSIGFFHWRSPRDHFANTGILTEYTARTSLPTCGKVGRYQVT
jgi:hypothetical protein